MRKGMKAKSFWKHFLILSVAAFLCMGLFLRVTAEEEEVFTARPDENGFLHVEDTSLIDEDGNVEYKLEKKKLTITIPKLGAHACVVIKEEA